MVTVADEMLQVRAWVILATGSAGAGFIVTGPDTFDVSAQPDALLIIQ